MKYFDRSMKEVSRDYLVSLFGEEVVSDVETQACENDGAWSSAQQFYVEPVKTPC